MAEQKEATCCDAYEWDAEENFCLGCGSDEQAQAAGNSKYANFVVGVVMTVKAVPKKNKLKAASIQIREVDEDEEDEDDGTVMIVTNTKHLSAGDRVVVALPGAIIPAGADPEEDGGRIVKTVSV